MQVRKRSGVLEAVSFDKITERISQLCEKNAHVDALEYKSLRLARECGKLRVDPIPVVIGTVGAISNGITTAELDRVAAAQAYSRALENPDYSVLAVRILVSNTHKSTLPTFSGAMRAIAEAEPRRLCAKHLEFITSNASALDAMIVHGADYDFDYFGISTLLRTYLISVNGRLMDRPQYIFMRVAVALYIDYEGDDKIDKIRECYIAMSRQQYTHATPTMLNACTVTGQVNSCFLFPVRDNIQSIMHLVSQISFTSKSAGGIGVHMTPIRAAGSLVRTTGGKASGVPRQLCIMNQCVLTWNQGGLRPGAMAAYLAIWHADIMDFITMGRHENVSAHAPDIFYGIWNCNLFMKRWQSGAAWSLFSPDTAPLLDDVYDGMLVCKRCGSCPNPNYTAACALADGGYVGAAVPCDTCDYESRDVFTMLYTAYERRGLAVRTVDPATIMHEVARSVSQIGMPYMCHKDHVNAGSNQMNIDTIHGSNLCTEIMEVTKDNTVACCALASINLVNMVHEPVGGKRQVDYDLLTSTVRRIVRSLDRTIDINKYPVDECIRNATDYRPIGIGVQGLANMFAYLRMPYLSDEARRCDLMIFETIYHAALTESVELAKRRKPYVGWEDSPAANGLLRHDLWKREAASRVEHLDPFDSGRYDWNALRAAIRAHGLRHSLHIALMPTASTAQIFGNNENTEPFSNIVYAKNVLGGRQTVFNIDAVRELVDAGLWDAETRARVTNTGSLSQCTNIPPEIRNNYPIVWELSQREIIKRAALRQQFIDQAQSLNIHLQPKEYGEEITIDHIEECFWQGWEFGLPTGSYYIRTQAAVKPIATNIVAAKAATKEPDGDVCRPGCDSCSG